MIELIFKLLIEDFFVHEFLSDCHIFLEKWEKK